MKPLALLCTFIASTVIAGTDGSAWTKSPFDQKVFIQNVGQFSDKFSSNILFGTNVDGVELYFTSRGATYRHDEAVPISEEEKEKAGRQNPIDEREEERRMMKSVSHSLSIEWVGANTDSKIITEDSVSFYYTYSAEPQTLLAHAFRKIIYKNLYPNIDVEYIFPEGKKGIKYSISVHPGGDASQIKMRYTGAEKIERDGEDNIVIKSSFGDFIDHAPVISSAQSGSSVESVVETDEVFFHIGAYDHAQELVIDPWTTNPNFSGYNAAYDVDCDSRGNVYVYGSWDPLKLAKFNNSGAIQWIFIAGNSHTRGYGDFAVDQARGTIYLIGDFYSPDVKILKVNTFGINTSSFTGDSVMDEMWRMVYDNKSNNLIIAAGGTVSQYGAAILDTDFTKFTPVSFFASGTHDMALLALDNRNDFCYMATAKSYSVPAVADNVIIKCPIPNLLPLAFSVPDNHKFLETTSETYVGGVKSGGNHTAWANGINGMAVNSNWLYTYDSDSLKRWNKNTGAFVSGTHVSPYEPDYYRSAIQVPWGGLAVDECDNVYAGVIKLIKVYDGSNSLKDSFALVDTVYDIKLASKKLYSCGKGFVTSLDVRFPCDSIVCDLLTISVRNYFEPSNGHCCSEFTLSNLYQAGIIYSVSAKLLTKNFKVETAKGPWSPGPSYNDSIITWSIPSPGLKFGTRDSLSACFTRSGDSTIKVQFTFYDAAGRPLCVDTLMLCGTSGVNDNGIQISSDIVLGESYPDPAITSVIIPFTLVKNEKVTLSVMDIFGREVLRLNNNEMTESGHHAIPADVSRLRSGVYCYSLRTASRTLSKLMRVAR